MSLKQLFWQNEDKKEFYREKEQRSSVSGTPMHKVGGANLINKIFFWIRPRKQTVFYQQTYAKEGLGKDKLRTNSLIFRL